jgi:hypothetical protein
MTSKADTIISRGKTMTKLDDFFRAQTEPLSHPRLRNWKARLERPGTTATVEVFRPESLLGVSSAVMNVEFTELGSPPHLETVAWDEDLNDGLIRLGVRASSTEQEAERFALGLRAAMRKAQRRFGDGYFNSVLVDLLRDSDIAADPRIAELFEQAAAVAIPQSRESRGDKGYRLCREMMEDAIRGRARELTDHLHYPLDEARGILVAALAHYLDDRFSVTARRRIGWL